MYDLVLLIAQILTVTALAAWITTGVWDNIVHPDNNRLFAAQVMALERMRQDYPTEYARVAHRAVNDPALHRLAFRFIVACEVLAMIVLWAGAGALVLSGFGAIPSQTALALAMLGTVLFTSVWSGFLVVGNYFCYWFCHEAGQNTHFQMTLWGLATLIVLITSGQ